MRRIARLRPLRWLLRFRKRCGYGIHSPFAFQFVTGVIYEKGAYYAYAPLHEARQKQRATSREKDDRLLFRIVNFHQPQSMVAIGEGAEFEMACRYMQAAHQCDFLSTTKWELPASVDLVYLHAGEWSHHVDQLLALSHNHLLLVVKKPHATSETLQAWKQLCSSPLVRQSFDLYDFGLCFFQSRLNKENFVINYY
jgi:hypothetical protein